jgi:purine-cytosine permease-like protein
MLTKVIKYDIRSTWRDFTGIFLAILLGVILVPMAMKNFSNELVRLTAGLVAFAIVIAVIAVTIINLFKIYNTNIFSKEG